MHKGQQDREELLCNGSPFTQISPLNSQQYREPRAQTQGQVGTKDCPFFCTNKVREKRREVLQWRHQSNPSTGPVTTPEIPWLNHPLFPPVLKREELQSGFRGRRYNLLPADVYSCRWRSKRSVGIGAKVTKEAEAVWRWNNKRRAAWGLLYNTFRPGVPGF
ncbi:hypothetical protein SKAU_G00268170 [Synaphobranchus kaupii]|uniref:Uncharacterized protein n=1 Tax=Synaphobranchus kaupii TaxID=118154 RepID=A0A9Q1EZS6_SYNKA|nr:hypothetical protein SKAU_G00268170 [Synaphobranchus kaupii]